MAVFLFYHSTSHVPLNSITPLPFTVPEWQWILIAIGVGLLLLLIMYCWCKRCCNKRNKKKNKGKESQGLKDSINMNNVKGNMGSTYGEKVGEQGRW